jgi:PPOX class probable F420-dependent enzyme
VKMCRADPVAPARELLESDAVAHVVTLDEDGGPHVTAAWVGIDGEIVFATLPEQRKLRNLRRDPRIALSGPSTKRNEWGLLEYLVVYGTARVTEGGAAEMLQRLACTYIGPCSRTCRTRRQDLSRGSRPSALAESGRGTRRADARLARTRPSATRLGTSGCGLGQS